MNIKPNRRRISTFCRLIGVVLLLGVTGIGQADQHTMIEDALSAAPPTLRDSATVMDWDGNVLRQGSANYTCYPTPAQLEGTAPMCMDGPWMKWADAWNNKKALTISNLGISYMLAGDEGASNIDPYAEGPTADNQWIDEGAHIMIVVPDPSMLDSFPTDPQQGGPYVMWKGTPYAHVMIPIGSR